MIKIDIANTSNPREFWNHVGNLGPQKSRKIPEAVKINGDLHNDINIVLEKWQSDFSNLHEKPARATKDYDSDFYNDTINRLNELEEQLTNSDSFLDDHLILLKSNL